MKSHTQIKQKDRAMHAEDLPRQCTIFSPRKANSSRPRCFSRCKTRHKVTKTHWGSVQSSATLVARDFVKNTTIVEQSVACRSTSHTASTPARFLAGKREGYTLSSPASLRGTWTGLIHLSLHVAEGPPPSKRHLTSSWQNGVGHTPGHTSLPISPSSLYDHSVEEVITRARRRASPGGVEV